MDPSQTLAQLETYLSQRIPYHKKYMKQALALTPIMLPFGLLPVVPNFPFLIAAWRCFSHYRAWKGAEWLLALVKDGKLQVKVDDDLGAALRPVNPKRIEGNVDVGVGLDVDGSQSGVKEDHAPDETSTPENLIQGGKKGDQEEENAILQTRHILEEGTPTSSPAGTEKGSSEKLDTQTKEAQAQGGSKSTSVPDPKSQEVAPDATGTPSSQIYTPKSGSDASSSSSTSTSTSTTNEPTESDEPATLTMENIPRLTETFGLKASEVVDLTRAVMQIKDKADRAIESEQK